VNTEVKLPKWKASLFALGSFGYFCCQKYKNDSFSDLDLSTGRQVPFFNGMTAM
jgi:hypothetical protein